MSEHRREFAKSCGVDTLNKNDKSLISFMDANTDFIIGLAFIDSKKKIHIMERIHSDKMSNLSSECNVYTTNVKTKITPLSDRLGTRAIFVWKSTVMLLKKVNYFLDIFWFTSTRSKSTIIV